MKVPFVVRRTRDFATRFLKLVGPYEYARWVDSPDLATPMPAAKAAQWATALRSHEMTEDKQPVAVPIDQPMAPAEEPPPDTAPSASSRIMDLLRGPAVQVNIAPSFGSGIPVR